ncbi:MAG TPA: hypothetical protein VF519_15800 [Mycobacteriales bacterium]
MNSTPARTTLAVLAVAALAACGGGDKPKTEASGAPAPTAPVVAIMTSTPTPSSGTASTKPGTGATPGASRGTTGATTGATPGGSTAPGGTPAANPTNGAGTMDIDAKMSKTCLRPGDSVTVTLHGRPGMNVVHNATYADGKDGEVHGGKEMHGMTDQNGQYTGTWTLRPSAPVGDATLYLAAVDYMGSGHDHLPFRVSLSC